MTRYLVGLLVWLLWASVPAWGDDGRAVSLGAQWVNALVDSCYTPNVGGWSCFYFPQETRLYGFAWEGSLKNDTDVLYMLTLGACPTCMERPLHRQYLQGITSSATKTYHFAHPILIPPGWYLWIYAISDFLTPSLEAHVMLDIDAGAQVYVLRDGAWALCGTC